MIQNSAQLQQTREALTHVENALAALRVRVEPANPALFAAMADDYLDDIRRLRAEIDAYVGLSVAQDSTVPLWMILEGESISRQNISSRILSEWLGNFRKALYGLSDYLETGRIRLSGGRPDAALLAATDPYVAALAPGSIKIGLKLPGQEQQEDLFEEDAERLPKPLLALRHLLLMANWAASGKTDVPDNLDINHDEMQVAARFAVKLAPSPKSSVSSVSFSGAAVPSERPVRLNAESRERLEGLKRILSHVSEETVYGQIREIDLDANRVILRERGEGLSDMKCQIPEALMDKAQKLLNQEVVVTGLVSSASPDTINARDLSPIARANER
jgi:hypothetical protein